MNNTVLVTGGTGFLGGFVTDRLISAGYDAVALGSDDCDLTDERAVDRLLDLYEPDSIIHLAAKVGGIGANQLNPGYFFRANALMGINIIHEAMMHEIKKTVVVGTICAYPKHAKVPFKEDDLWSGYPEETNAPYGIAKKSLLVMAQAYREQFGTNAIYLLPVNLYGPYDNINPTSSHVIPALIRKIVDAKRNNSKVVTIWGSGQVSREFLYVDDAAEAIVLALENYDSAEPVNIGTGQEIKIIDLAEKIARIVGWAGEWEFDISKPDGQPRRCLDVSKAEKFGFEAKTSLDEGLRKTIDWYVEKTGQV